MDDAELHAQQGRLEELRAEWARLQPEWDGPPFARNAPLEILAGYAIGVLRSPPGHRNPVDRRALRAWTRTCLELFGREDLLPYLPEALDG